MRKIKNQKINTIDLTKTLQGINFTTPSKLSNYKKISRLPLINHFSNIKIFSTSVSNSINHSIDHTFADLEILNKGRQ